MKKILITAAIALLLCACSKDDNTPAPDPTPDPTPEVSVQITAITGIASDDIAYIGKELTISATVAEADVTYTWSVDGTAIGSGNPIKYTPTKQGVQKLKVSVTKSTAKDEKELTFNVFRPTPTEASKWISSMIEYRPAPGQFINKSPGNMASAEGIVGKRGMVTLGGYGGYITFGFDHTVLNGEGPDFVIHGNAFEGSSEAGAVAVAFDANGNGKPDADEWVELRGSEYDKTTKDYQITYTRPAQTDVAENVLWHDNKGGNGQVSAISFHRQCYYPLFLSDNPAELSFTGNLVANTATEAGGIWKLATLEWGYADNASEDYNDTVNDDPDTARSNKFDIANAVDKSGKAVSLKGVDFIKVYNCLNQEAGWLGEASTEVCGAISLTVGGK